MSSSVGAKDVNLEKLRSDAMRGEWLEVFETCKQNRALYTTKITGTGDTVLHMAVSNAQEWVVAKMLKFLVREGNNLTQNNVVIPVDGDEVESWSVNIVLGAENDRKNTPLHLAAVKGNVEMCEKIGGIDKSLIARRNIDGETPLFLAALYDRKEAFLCLHYLYMEGPGVPSTDLAHCIRDDNDTILHCAIAEEHFDVAIEIVHLYKDLLKEMMRRNKEGLSPFHLLATKLSIFKTTALLERSFLVRQIYGSLKVKEKNQATTLEELPIKNQEDCFLKLIRSDSVRSILHWLPLFLLILITAIFGPAYYLPTHVLLILLGSFAVSAIWLRHKFRKWIRGIRKMKEEHVWSLQILEILLQHASNEDKSVITSRKPFQRLLTCPEVIEENEAGSKIVDSPLMIAAKNGVIGMVKKILRFYPSGMNVLDDEGKNIVLLAAEKRQTKLYQFLYRDRDDNTAFKQVDQDGNTALHLAAKPGINLYGQTTTMIEEFKWFEFVKSSVPSELWERYNKEGKTAEEIFRDSYKEHMTSDRKWLDQTSQTCSVASTLVAGMAFSNFAGENIKKKNDASLVALSLSLTSTISFLAILAFRSQSLNFWKYVPFMLHIAILTMFGSIVALWISLMFHGQSITTCAILGSPIAIFTIVSLPIFIGPTVISMFNLVPPPNRNTTNAIQYRRPQKKENEVDKDQKTTPNPTFRGTDPIQDIAGSPDDTFKQ